MARSTVAYGITVSAKSNKTMSFVIKPPCNMRRKLSIIRRADATVVCLLVWASSDNLGRFEFNMPEPNVPNLYNEFHEFLDEQQRPSGCRILTQNSEHHSGQVFSARSNYTHLVLLKQRQKRRSPVRNLGNSPPVFLA